MIRPRYGWLCITLALAAFSAQAQLRPCAGVSEPGLKVLLDDIHGVDRIVLAVLKQRLDAALRAWSLAKPGQSDANGAPAGGVRIRALRCEQRSPTSDTDFTAPLVRELNNAEVVLEVWAQTQALKPSEGRGVRAVVGYALIPVRHYEPRSVFGVVMSETTVPAASTPEQLLALLDQSGRLALYAELASGLRLLNSQAHAQARTQFCSALSRLDRTANTTDTDADLRTYLQALSVQALERAQQTTSALRVLDATPCDLSPL